MVYAVADPLLRDLLQVARAILNRRLVGVRALLRELETGERAEWAEVTAKHGKERRGTTPSGR